MVAQGIDAAPSPSKQITDSRRAASERAATVQYESRRTWTADEASVAVSKVNWWYPSVCWKNLPLPAGMLPCGVCGHVNPPAYGSVDLNHQMHICEDCRAKEHTLRLEALRWFEASHFYLDWWQRGAKWYAGRPMHFRDVNRLEDNDVHDRYEDHPDLNNTFARAAHELKMQNAYLDEAEDQFPDESLITDLLASYVRAGGIL